MKTERRQSPRISYYLPLKISSTDSEVVTETKNISSHGAYCLINKDVDLMTKLKIIMHVPILTRSVSILSRMEKRKFHKIECMGVIVRKEHPKDIADQKKMHGIGIFFYEIKDKDKTYIDKFVQHILTQAGAVHS